MNSGREGMIFLFPTHGISSLIFKHTKRGQHYFLMICFFLEQQTARTSAIYWETPYLFQWDSGDRGRDNGRAPFRVKCSVCLSADSGNGQRTDFRCHLLEKTLLGPIFCPGSPPGTLQSPPPGSYLTLAERQHSTATPLTLYQTRLQFLRAFYWDFFLAIPRR